MPGRSGPSGTRSGGVSGSSGKPGSKGQRPGSSGTSGWNKIRKKELEQARAEGVAEGLATALAEAEALAIARVEAGAQGSAVGGERIDKTRAFQACTGIARIDIEPGKPWKLPVIPPGWHLDDEDDRTRL
jgi:hypothetical protein